MTAETFTLSFENPYPELEKGDLVVTTKLWDWGRKVQIDRGFFQEFLPEYGIYIIEVDGEFKSFPNWTQLAKVEEDGTGN